MAAINKLVVSFRLQGKVLSLSDSKLTQINKEKVLIQVPRAADACSVNALRAWRQRTTCSDRWENSEVIVKLTGFILAQDRFPNFRFL
jgi:hypothetical protein